MNREMFIEKISELPLYQFEFFKTEELQFVDRIREICKTQCPMYGKTWACPPGVGSLEECQTKCLKFEDAVLIVTVVEVNDISDIEETLSTRGDHEDITRDVKKIMGDLGAESYVLSSEACAYCEDCTYPDAPCRYPEHMFPCIESHCILVTEIAEKFGIEFIYGSNMVMWFSMLLYND